MAAVVLAISLPGVVAFILMERYVLRKLFARFDRIGSYLFLVTVGWCLGVAALSRRLDYPTKSAPSSPA